MAKKSVKARTAKRVLLEKKYRAKRQNLKTQVQEAYVRGEIPWEAQQQLQKMPRNSHPTRIKRRCRLCGRPRSIYKKFGLCRLCLRKYVMKGCVPGLVKASW